MAYGTLSIDNDDADDGDDDDDDDDDSNIIYDTTALLLQWKKCLEKWSLLNVSSPISLSEEKG